jgi:peptidoglycan/xylan/chitin deacetylase (PgdA/CDA1 family)
MRRIVHWPGNKKICATFTVAFEAYLRGGHHKTTDVPGVNMVAVSHANYGGNAGIWRIMEILDRHKARATVDINGLAAERWPEATIALHRAGHEIAGHGYTNEVKMTALPADEQRAEIRRVTDIVTKVVGKRPVGWVSPGGNHTAETMGILADEGYTWWGDPCDDDPPYVENVNGKRIVIIPKHWFFNDLRGWNGGGLGGAEAFQAFKYSFDFVYEEAKRGRPGRIDALVHAELGGRPYMAHAFERMVEYCKQFEDELWLPTRDEIADFMLRREDAAIGRSAAE